MRWYVVASQKEARIFVKTPEQAELRSLKVLTNPLGNEKRRDLIKKQAGHGVRSIGHVGSIHYSEKKRHDPHEDALIQFTKELVLFLEKEKGKNNFEFLTIVAEPHLLGKIRKEMPAHLRDSVTGWIKKDLQKVPLEKLGEFLLPRKTASHDLRQFP